jgi:hypothetical protein
VLFGVIEPAGWFVRVLVAVGARRHRERVGSGRLDLDRSCRWLGASQADPQDATGISRQEAKIKIFRRNGQCRRPRLAPRHPGEPLERAFVSVRVHSCWLRQRVLQADAHEESWESKPSGLLYRLSCKAEGRLSVIDGERPVFAGANGTLMAWRPWPWPGLMAFRLSANDVVRVYTSDGLRSMAGGLRCSAGWWQAPIANASRYRNGKPGASCQTPNAGSSHPNRQRRSVR